MKILLKMEKHDADRVEICEIDIKDAVAKLFGEACRHSCPSLVFVDNKDRELQIIPDADPDYPAVHIELADPQIENGDPVPVISVNMPMPWETATMAWIYNGSEHTEADAPIACMVYGPREKDDESCRVIHIDKQRLQPLDMANHELGAQWPTTVKEQIDSKMR